MVITFKHLRSTKRESKRIGCAYMLQLELYAHLFLNFTVIHCTLAYLIIFLFTFHHFTVPSCSIVLHILNASYTFLTIRAIACCKMTHHNYVHVPTIEQRIESCYCRQAYLSVSDSLFYFQSKVMIMYNVVKLIISSSRKCLYHLPGTTRFQRPCASFN